MVDYQVAKGPRLDENADYPHIHLGLDHKPMGTLLPPPSEYTSLLSLIPLVIVVVVLHSV
jgi:hypothetical protein